MIKINLNHLAQEICAFEGGKVQVNIAQVKDVLRAAMDILAARYVTARVLKKAKKKKKK